MRRARVACVAQIVLASPANAEPFEDGLAAMQRGDHEAALFFFRPLAEKGHAAAQYCQGTMYDNEQALEVDHAEAASRYRKAAERGHAMAQNNLGYMYQNGQGVPQDDAEAANWYRKAAEQGFTDAQMNLGGLYAKGHGVRPDDVFAYMWSTIAAASGDSRALENQEIIGTYMTPDKITKAQRLAREWMEKHQQ
jgi:hypothetical protein